ncbi:MAG: hypothetical protein R6V45_12145, partial [Oceanipulchritudo sp.]
MEEQHLDETLLDRHPAFTRWEDPESGAVSYLLTERTADYQKAWYFMEPGLRGRNPALWFYACDPPSRQWYTCAETYPRQRVGGRDRRARRRQFRPGACGTGAAAGGDGP